MELIILIDFEKIIFLLFIFFCYWVFWVNDVGVIIGLLCICVFFKFIFFDCCFGFGIV